MKLRYVVALLFLYSCQSTEEKKAIAAVEQHIEAKVRKSGPYTAGHSKTQKGIYVDPAGQRVNGIYVWHQFEVEMAPDKMETMSVEYFVDYTGEVTPAKYPK